VSDPGSSEHRWSERQRDALVHYAQWIGLAWGALLGLGVGALLPWDLAQTAGALVGAVIGLRTGRRVNAAAATRAG